MVDITELRAAKKFGPGYFIREEMELREWTQEDLADVMGITPKHLNAILREKQPLTLEIARLLGEVFNTSVQYWINIDTAYRLWKEQDKSEREKAADLKGMIYERMPINDMIKKGWLLPYEGLDELKEQVMKFWGMKSLDFSPHDANLLPCLTRKSEAYNQYNASYALTWYRKACLVAETWRVKPYDQNKLKSLYERLHSYTIADGDINEFLYELNEAGVIFFVLSHLSKTYLDGAAFFSGSNPVIVYTGRYKRIDNFWFTIAHEIAHIIKHIDDKTPFILDNFSNKERSRIEDEANSLAAKMLKHNDIAGFLEPYLAYLTTSRVEECAEKYEIHPAIIIGKLAHDGKVSYVNQKLYNDNVLEFISKEYII
jgi:HTH-type transcriptional regulator/antitoxin HigA